ncbi:MAG: TolC family protein [Bacteroidales bacterium]|nr:TolC family protein [Bacteroidales bacterium]
MKIIIKSVIALILVSGNVSAQLSGQLTLDSCYKLALAHNPLSRQGSLYNESYQLQESALNDNYLPQVSVGGQLSWQSDVTALPINIPNMVIPSLDKDSYKLNLDVNQLIWDGGLTRKQKELEKAGLLVNMQSVDAENYRLRETVNQVYFSILLIQENVNLIKLSMSEVQSRLGTIRAGVSNGMILQSNAEVLDAEIIRLEQMLTELVHSRDAAIFRLGELTGQNFGPDLELGQPVFDSLPQMNTRLRPEYHLLELQQEKISVLQNMTGLKVMPRITAFGTIGYGKPGLNMLSNSFDAFAMAGARFSWTLWNWNQHKKESEIIGIQKEVIETQKENFERNQRILLNNLNQEILKTETLIAADHRILKLRESIEKSAGAQLNQGIITSSEYLTEQNAQTQARFNMSLHKLQLQYARLNFIATIGLLK